MQYIENLKIDSNKCSFHLNNSSSNIKISLANAIRRIIISNIPTYAIAQDKTTFFENNSVFSNEFLKHRLSLVPIISWNKDINYENIVITCKKKNENEYTDSVYVKDFVCKDIETDKVIDNSILFSHENILFAKLKYNQFISFEAKLSRNTAEGGGSFHSPVSICLYTFEIDEKEANRLKENMNEKEKLDFNTEEIQRIYKKNKNGEPNRYSFQIEGIGFYKMDDILKMGIEILINKLVVIQNEFKNKNSTKVLLNNETQLDFYDFSLEDENETIGNILSTYLLNDDNIYYCGYLIEHPLKKNIILRIKLKENNSIENIIDVIDKNISKIIDILK